MPVRKLNPLTPIVLGPEPLGAVARAVEMTLPVLTRTTFRFLPNGNFEVPDNDAADALRSLRQAVEGALEPEVRDHVGRQSGLGWNIFFAHVVAFWIPLRNRMGFLRALADRAALHGVGLSLQWNQGRPVAPRRRAPGPWPLVIGSALGLVAAILAQREFPYEPLLALLLAGAGLVGGRLWQRVVGHRVCGDRLCQAPLGRADRVCESCGATVAARG